MSEFVDDAGLDCIDRLRVAQISCDDQGRAASLQDEIGGLTKLGFGA